MQALRTIITEIFVKQPVPTAKKVTTTITTTITATVKGDTCSISGASYPQYADYELTVQNGWSSSFNKCQFLRKDIPDIIATLTALYEGTL